MTYWYPALPATVSGTKDPDPWLEGPTALSLLSVAVSGTKDPDPQKTTYFDFFLDFFDRLANLARCSAAAKAAAFSALSRRASPFK